MKSANKRGKEKKRRAKYEKEKNIRKNNEPKYRLSKKERKNREKAAGNYIKTATDSQD